MGDEADRENLALGQVFRVDELEDGVEVGAEDVTRDAPGILLLDQPEGPVGVLVVALDAGRLEHRMDEDPELGGSLNGQEGGRLKITGASEMPSWTFATLRTAGAT